MADRSGTVVERDRSLEASSTAWAGCECQRAVDVGETLLKAGKSVAECGIGR
jgi:hypothetical protein